LHARKSNDRNGVAPREARGCDIVARSPAERAVFIRRDVTKYEKLVKTAGIRIA